MKMQRIFVILLFILATCASANDPIKLKKVLWPFEGILGSIDREAAQRGFQVYKEVCAACHGLRHLSYRNLKDIGISDAEIKQIAKDYTVTDGPNAQGEMFQRPATPADKFVNPFANEEAARAANGGAFPVDLSLIIKARADGANYVYSLLTGYTIPPADEKVPDGLYYNEFFPGKLIAMPAPLMADGQVQYRAGTTSSIDQMARDVVVFIQWAAEPEMEHRKSLGLKTMIYLLIFTLLFYIVKRKIWAKVN